VAAAPAIEGFCLSYRAPADTSEAALEAAADTLDARLGAVEIAGDALADHDARTIDVQLKPGPQDLAAATDLAASLGATGLLEFMPVPPELQGLVEEGPLPEGMQDTEPLFTGVEVDSATTATDDTIGELVVDLQLNDTGARLFDEFAADHYGEQFAIVVDDEVLSAPFIQATRFGGRAQISGGVGGLSPGEAQALVAVASSGALPVELSLDEVRACPVSAALTVQTPLALLARAGEDLEVPATQVAMRLHDLGLDDFVITLHPETERITATILSADPALVGPVEGALSAEWLGDGIDVDFADDTLDAFLAGLPDQPVALRWSGQVPDGTEWQPAKGALIGDPSDLGTGEPAGVDVEAVLETYGRREAFDALLSEVTEDPGFVGFSGLRDGATVLLFARDSVPRKAIRRLAGYGVPVFPGAGVSEIRGEEIDLTLKQVKRIRATVADILSEHGLDPDELGLSFDLERKPAAFIPLSDPEAEESIREAVRERLGKGVVELWFFDQPVGE
jgi:hypothetical protein